MDLNFQHLNPCVFRDFIKSPRFHCTIAWCMKLPRFRSAATNTKGRILGDFNSSYWPTVGKFTFSPSQKWHQHNCQGIFDLVVPCSLAPFQDICWNQSERMAGALIQLHHEMKNLVQQQQTTERKPALQPSCDRTLRNIAPTNAWPQPVSTAELCSVTCWPNIFGDYRSIFVEGKTNHQVLTCQKQASTMSDANEAMEWSTFLQFFESSVRKVSLQDAIQKPPINNSSPKKKKQPSISWCDFLAEPGPAGIFPDETVGDVFLPENSSVTHNNLCRKAPQMPPEK